LKQVLRTLAPRQVVPMGSAGLKGAQVADGSADAYLALGPAGKYWDACAVDALVTAAGGRVTDARGRLLSYRSPLLELDEGLLAANAGLHEELLARLGTAAS
jgi:3'-phosphoadenosine 5'-phosphosulfate (PAPS) 3'-phosphatase